MLSSAFYFALRILRFNVNFTKLRLIEFLFGASDANKQMNPSDTSLSDMYISLCANIWILEVNCSVIANKYDLK